MALSRIRAKIERNILFGRDLVRIRTQMEKTAFLVGLWLGLNLEKTTPFVVRFWLGLGQKKRKTPFLIGLWLR